MNHATAASQFVANDQRAHWHDKALWFVREKRDRLPTSCPNGRRCESGRRRSRHTIANLAELLEQFEANAQETGRARSLGQDAAEHNQIVLEILQQHRAQNVVKSKSMLTEECHLNPFLERHGINVIDTDLGERIVQFRDEPPSHIVLPAIHIKKEEVGELFHERLGTEAGLTDPKYLTEAARSICAKSSLQPMRASRASTSPSRKPVASSFAPTKATRTWAFRCRSCTSPAWASRS